MNARDIPAEFSGSTEPRHPSTGAFPPNPLDRLPGAFLAAITAALYFALASICLRLLVRAENIAPIWPVNAVVIAMMSRLDRRRWHWVLTGQAAGCLLANLAASIPITSICCYIVGNVSETLVAVMILTRLGTQTIDFSSRAHFFRLMVAAGPGNALTAAIVAAANFLLAHGANFIGFWQIWASTDCLGIFIVVPALLSFRRPVRGQANSYFTVEVCCLLGVFVLIAGALFTRKWPVELLIINRPLLITLPFLLWAALRTNVFVVSLMSLLLSSVAVAGTLMGRGPFIAAEPTPERAIVILQLTLLAWACCGLIISIVTAEIRRALDEASRDRERFRQLTEFNNQIIASVQDGIIVLDRELRYRVWSPAMEQLSGLPAAGVLGRTPLELFPFLREAGVITLLERALAGETISSPDFPYEVPETGRKGWSWQLMGPLRSADGRIIGVITTVRDITQRKEAQDSLALLQALFDQISEGINVVESETARLLYVNEELLAQSGYTREEITSMTVFDINPAMNPETFAQFKDEIRKQGIKVWETVRRRKDGTIMPVEVSVKRVQLDREYFVSVVRDFTERRRNEELLRQSHERFQVLAAATFEGILISENGFIIDCNEQLARIVGYARDELIGMAIEALIAPEDRERILANVAMGREGNAQHGGICKDGSRIIVEGRGGTISYSGRRVRITAIRDVTHRIRMEEMAIQSEKMLSIGGLAAGMAHEINNPLAIMMQNTEVISSRINSQSPQNRAAAERAGTTLEAIRAYMEEREILEMLEGVHTSGARAAAIVKNMLAFSRPNSTRKGTHRLDGVVMQAIDLARSDYELKKEFDLSRIEIVNEFDTDLPPVACHGGEVQQVLLNLFRNAAQAFAADTRQASAPRIIVRTRREKDRARIEVEDNGPGMPESVRRRVFEPFFTTKSAGEGTGLGLFISYFIISQHHQGTICVNPAPCGGSRFEFILPIDGMSRDELTRLPG